MATFVQVYVLLVALDTICMCGALMVWGKLPEVSQGARIFGFLFELGLGAWALWLLAKG